MTNQLQHHQRRAVDLRIPAIEKALLFASILLNTEFAVNEQVNDFSGLALDDRHRSTTIAVNILGRIIMASVSAVGIYAVVSGRAALLMPLYAILLVDFFFSLPSFYNRDFDPSMADNMAEFRNTGPNSQYTRYSLMLFSTIAMIVKIYFLCVIWKCYRYLRLIELVSPLRLSEIYPHIHPHGPQYPIVRVLGSTDSTDLSTGHNMVPPPYESIASNMKPPNYEEAMKSSTTNFANPTYSQQQPQQQTVVFTNPASEQHLNVSTQVANGEQHSTGPPHNTINNATDSAQSTTVDTTSMTMNTTTDNTISTSSATQNVADPVMINQIKNDASPPVVEHSTTNNTGLQSSNQGSQNTRVDIPEQQHSVGKDKNVRDEN